DEVAELGGVLLVVRVELRRAADDLLVARVRLHGVDLDHDRLVHRIRDDDAAALLAPAALVVGLRQPHDRAALGRALALRLRVLVPLRARHALALRLGTGLRRSRLFGGRLVGVGLCCRLFSSRLFSRRLFGRGLLGSGLFGRRLLRWRLFSRRLLSRGLLRCRRLSLRLGGRLLRSGLLGGSLGLGLRLFRSLFGCLVLF